MTIISALKTYIATYSGLATGAPLWVDFLGNTPAGYSIVPLPGTKKIERFIDSDLHFRAEFPFALQCMFSTADEVQRLANNEFFESFSAWLDTQTDGSVLPTMSAKQTPEKIEALDAGYLYEQGSSSTGVYQIQCKLTYEQFQ